MCRLIANQKMSVYKCPKCEAEFLLGTKFCEKCGCNLETEFIETPTCPKCGKVFPIGTVFCNEHGVKLASPEQLIPRCGKCEKQYTDGTKYCPDCGGSVGVSMFLTNRNLSSVNDFVQTMPIGVSGLVEKFGVLAGTIGVIFFSLFNWVYYYDGWYESTWVGRQYEYYFWGSSLFGLLNGFNVNVITTGIVFQPDIFVISMIVSFFLLITSLLMKPQLKAKSTLAYSGFGLCAIVTTIFIILITMTVFSVTIFPFLTLAVAILAMKFLVKRPTKKA